MEVWGGTLALFTKELEMGDGDRFFPLGQFLIELPICGTIRIFNLSRKAPNDGRYYAHPCVRQTDGQPCWGGFSRALRERGQDSNLPLLVDLIFEFLETWSSNNPIIQPAEWHRRSEKLSAEEREKLVADREKNALVNLSGFSSEAVAPDLLREAADSLQASMEQEFQRQQQDLTSAYWTTTSASTVSPSWSTSPSVSVSEGDNEDSDDY